jgi:hypothetical protein
MSLSNDARLVPVSNSRRSPETAWRVRHNLGLGRIKVRSTDIHYGYGPSTTLEERRILRELQKKLRVLNDDRQRLARIGDAESLRLMRERSTTRDHVQAAYNELRERIDVRLKFPG